ncbi:hypothetical protein B0H13DRAFT_1006774 [Mycena leptocephala]|nr:hypothetical protein B0H13DRAFT_1006774 [Mycena leptocephala]
MDQDVPSFFWVGLDLRSGQVLHGSVDAYPRTDGRTDGSYRHAHAERALHELPVGRTGGRTGAIILTTAHLLESRSRTQGHTTGQLTCNDIYSISEDATRSLRRSGLQLCPLHDAGKRYRQPACSCAHITHWRVIRNTATRKLSGDGHASAYGAQDTRRRRVFEGSGRGVDFAWGFGGFSRCSGCLAPQEARLRHPFPRHRPHRHRHNDNSTLSPHPCPSRLHLRLVFGVRLVAVISSRGLDEFPSPLDAISAASLVALSLIVFGHSLRTLSPLVVALISSTSVVTTSSPGVYSASFRCPFKLSDLSVIIRSYSSTQPRLHLLAPDPHARARPSCWVYLGRRGRINSRTGAFRPYHSVH